MKKVLALVLVALAVFSAGAQSAQAVSDILAKDAATYQDFSYLIASETGTDRTPADAFAWCGRFGTFPAGVSADTPITVRSVSHFFMSHYGLDGGLMWRLTKSPRYAWRELKQEGFWPAGTDPDETLSGSELVRAIGRFFETWPEAKIGEPAPSGSADGRQAAHLANPEGSV